MHIVPYLERELQSKRPVQDVADRLYRSVDPRYQFFWDTPIRDCSNGELTQIRFQLIPINKVSSKYNRTFEPVVTGRIEKRNSGTAIRLIMRLGWQNACLLYLWVVLTLIALFRTVPNVLAETDLRSVFPFVVVVLMGLSVPCVICYHFQNEANSLLAEIQKRL